MKPSVKILAPLAVYLGLLVASPALGDPWIDAGRDGGRRLLIDIGSILPSNDGSVSALLMVFPRNWSSRNASYEGWIARYDCAEKTRTVTAVRRYSPDHDPVLETPSRIDGGSAVQRQARLVCDPENRTIRQQFQTLRDVDSWLNR